MKELKRALFYLYTKHVVVVLKETVWGGVPLSPGVLG